MTSDRDVARRLLSEQGTTYAAQAGITMRDKPMPLFQLLVLSLLASTRISADVAAASARELFRAGWRTPRRLGESTWQQRVDALGRGGYRRYDESTATRLETLAGAVTDDWGGDLRRLRPAAPDEVPHLRRALEGFNGIGPAGAGIFCREVQAVWPEVRPFLDPMALAGAKALGLPTEPETLASLVAPDELAALAAALA